MVRRFGHTWWGQAWIEALETKAGIDPNRLPRGRTYARQERVVRLELRPGHITALVRGSRALPYRVSIVVPTHGDREWAQVAAAIAGRAAHAAALLDGELHPGVLADARAAGVELLPRPGDLRPRCSCPDWADPCKHAAAVFYEVADVLDGDPFALFALRGRTREALLGEVRAARIRSASQAGAPGAPGAPGADRVGASGDVGSATGVGPGGSGRMVAEAFGGGAMIDPGMLARDAWTRAPALPPDRRETPRAPGTPAAWPTDPPRDAPFTAAGLTELAADAAQRAWAQLAEGAPSGLDLDERTDLARRAAGTLDRPERLRELSRRVGLPLAQLTHQALAWQHAGAEGLEAVTEALWRPPASLVDQALAAFDEAHVAAEEVQVRSNRFTAGDVQLRVSSDGRWWRYERRGRTWELAEPPAADPGALLSG
ncbi:MAG: hypothetical protein JWN46_3810 [Acidimicrobiales bacterium]|nr:hypothetical protein [Acidimicrobiales bacterium]